MLVCSSKTTPKYSKSCVVIRIVPTKAQTICNILAETDISIEAVALLARARSAIHAALIVKDDEQQAVVPIGGIDALAVGCAAGCPIVIAETLARKLTPRNG